jgi:hypothetical protein
VFWWAHLDFTRVKIDSITPKNQFEDVLEIVAAGKPLVRSSTTFRRARRRAGRSGRESLAADPFTGGCGSRPAATSTSRARQG